MPLVTPGYIECPECRDLNKITDMFCWECSASLHPRSGNTKSQQPVGPLHNLCCDRLWTECTCTEPLTYDDADVHISRQTNILAIDVYAPNTQCDMCALQWSGSCPEYRQYLVDYTNTEDHVTMGPELAPEAITPCSSFESGEDYFLAGGE